MIKKQRTVVKNGNNSTFVTFIFLFRNDKIFSKRKTKGVFYNGNHRQKNFRKQKKKKEAQSAKKEDDLKFVEKVKNLHDDFEFIGKCNLSTNELTNDDLNKIDEIASKTYTRYFSRAVGLSKNELQNISIEKANNPEVENLIQDREEQINAPYHNGEKFNLKVIKGTINNIEKSKIKEYAANTLSILSEIPFPQEYSDILEIIKTHKNIMKEVKSNKTATPKTSVAVKNFMLFL